jgi:hypothetical protein
MEMSFAKWMAEVNSYVEANCGVGCADLPDVGYRDMYDVGCEPESAAAIVLEEVAEHFPY